VDGGVAVTAGDLVALRGGLPLGFADFAFLALARNRQADVNASDVERTTQNHGELLEAVYPEAEAVVENVKERRQNDYGHDTLEHVFPPEKHGHGGKDLHLAGGLTFSLYDTD